MGRNKDIDGYGIGRSPSGVNHDPQRVTLGWTDCGHNNYQPGTVLDPFAGTGTTLVVAEYHGRNAIGIDIDERNALLVDRRREEVRRNLNPTHVKQVDGQVTLW